MSSGVARPPDAAPDLRREEDLERAYRQHGHEIRRFAAHRLGDQAAAADVVQEVFVRAWRHAHTFDPTRASLRSWLYAIARNVVIDQIRRRRTRPDQPGTTASDELTELADSRTRSPDFDDELATSWMLREALGQIGHDQRHAIVETHVRGRPYAEVADDEGVPVGTLRSRVFYGLKNLRTVLDDMGAQL